MLGKGAVKRSINAALDGARAISRTGGRVTYEMLTEDVLDRLQRERQSALLPVVNATGVLLHTNLGRAPLAAQAFDAMRRCGAGYSNVEYDVDQGTRGSRYARAADALKDVTGAQDALVVNNCAAAVLLVLDTLAKGREVVVSRNQLVEVGGGFRLPEVLERSGARLVEVGATNKVYLRDFERALSPRTAMILRSHPSNYRITGFTHDVDAKDLVALGKRTGVPVVEDLGSGALVDLAEYGLPRERTVQEAVADDLDLVTFSGDKLLGGPQAGVIVGKPHLIARLRNNPLIRALRVDKLTIAALVETLRLYAAPEERSHIPLFRMLGASREDLMERAREYCAELAGAKTVDATAYVGGGSLPESGVASLAVAVVPKGNAQDAAKTLRRAPLPIVARIENDRLFFDLRTIAPHEDREVIAAIRSIL